MGWDKALEKYVNKIVVPRNPYIDRVEDIKIDVSNENDEVVLHGKFILNREWCSINFQSEYKKYLNNHNAVLKFPMGYLNAMVLNSARFEQESLTNDLKNALKFFGFTPNYLKIPFVIEYQINPSKN